MLLFLHFCCIMIKRPILRSRRNIMAKNVPKTTANTENNVYNQHKTTTCRITDEDEKNEKVSDIGITGRMLGCM